MAAGIYLHIPFCRSRCSYCDFATDVYRSGKAVQRYVDALCKEITHGNGKIVADTVYFGGGTPSMLTPGQVGQILDELNSRFDVDSAAEITMEMNPATVTAESLAGYKCLGVNRASFGVQTFDDVQLRRLARGHDAEDARRTYEMLRKARFGNISFDLIIGLPRQTISDWGRNLDEALAMGPEHLSLYLLEIHEGTPLAEQVRTGRQPVPDDELAAEMYDLMQERVASAGYHQYEISNFARPGFESRHNSKYWTLDPVYGFGVSAHSFDGLQRYSNERDTARYVEQIEVLGSAEVARESIDTASETAFLRLRLTDGIDLREYEERFGIDLGSKFESEIEELADAQLVVIENGRLRLTRKGMLFSNVVFSVFV